MSPGWDHIIPSLAQKLGYDHLQDWQANITQEVLDGKDIVLTAGTGQGKSTILLAPLLAKHEVDPKAVGLSVAPTKALGEDQVRFIHPHPSACRFLIYERFRHNLPHQRGSRQLQSTRTHCARPLLRCHRGTYSMKC